MRYAPSGPTGRRLQAAGQLCAAWLLATITGIVSVAIAGGAGPAPPQASAPSLRPAAPSVLRIVTLNVADGICTTAVKSEGNTRWTALARLVAALKPDVLLLQEAGDNSGNGTGSGVDGVAGLEVALRLFVNGGTDPFLAGAPAVGAYVRAYDPSVVLPHVLVSTRTDGYNRNALLSRYPFKDLNGDGKATQSDLPPLLPDAWAAGGNGGLRGWLSAEIDLPDDRWPGDLVVGNSHLKAGTSAADHLARVDAARNIAYFLEHVYNGAGGDVPDPHDAVDDQPPIPALLPPACFVVVGGDLNEDEVLNGEVKGPAAWIEQAEFADDAGGADGPDRDGTDMALSGATDPYTGTAATQFGTTRDYLAYHDSLAVAADAFVFDTATLPADGSATPPELLGFASGWPALSMVASDHRAVVLDLAPPTVDAPDVEDLGHGKPGSGGAVPRFGVRAGAATAGSLQVLLRNAVPLAPAWLVVSHGAGRVPRGPALVPEPPLHGAPFRTGSDGALVVDVPRDAALSDVVLYAQWAVLDAGAAGGASLSNALSLTWP